ncbi:MAG TPA: TolC family protein, partial [Longimicrobiales bacterium]|nr:TolC family protein [Longimicrobiales bacterium]
GLRIDNQRAALETAEIQSQITDLQVRAQIENVAYQVRQAYWALRAAIEQVEIQRLNLEQAQRTLEQDRELVRLGRRTELQLLQSEAQVASAEQSRLNAEIQWRNQELAFKRLLVNGPNDPLFNQVINPVDLPVIVDQEVDIDAAIQTALRERADIRQQRYQREITLLNLDVSRSNALPDLSLTASYSVQGVGGNLFERSGLGGDPVLVQPGGYMDGLRALSDFDAPTWNISLNGSYPLGTNTSKLNHERAEIQARQAELQLAAQELNIITQVTSAGLAVRNTYLQLEAARRNRAASERNAEAAMLRYRLGAATNFEAVAAQNQLTQARLSELQATINHVNAIAEFERVQYIGN